MRPAVRRALLVGAAGVVAEPFVEPHLPVLRRVQVPVLRAGAAPLRVLHVSDLHLLPRQRRKAAWLSRLARLAPDLVVSTGDHLSSADAIAPMAAAMAPLAATGAPAIFVPGNNDYYTPVRPHLLDYLRGGSVLRRRPDLPWEQASTALQDAGWTSLTCRRLELDVAGTPVLLGGTDDAHLGRDRYERVAGPVPPGVLGIGVTHTPARRLLQAFARDGYHLVLAGHTHGGQLRLPGIGPLTTNCDLPRSRARGLTRDGRTWLHVSAGLGSSPYLPVRTACRPEATLLELVPGPGEPGVR